MNKRTPISILFLSILFLLLSSGFSLIRLSSVHSELKNNNQTIQSIFYQSDNDPENEDFCGLYESDCEDSSNASTKNVEVDLVRAENAQVNIIFFWMQDCAHCTEVLNSLLPEMYLTFGDQIYFYPIELKDIEEIDVFYQMAERLGVPKNNIGVPLMIVGDQVLSGNQIESDLEKAISELLPAPDYSFVAMPEFEERLPEFLRGKQAEVHPSYSNQSEHDFPIKTTFPLALVIALPLVTIAGVLVAVIYKKSRQIT